MVKLYQLMLKKPSGRTVSLGDLSEFPTMANHMLNELSPFLNGAELKVGVTEMDDESYKWAKNMAHKIAGDMR